MNNKMVRIVFSVLVLLGCNQKRTLEKYDNGMVKLECEMSNGKRNGECIQYYINGNVEYVSHYKNDRLNGVSKFFHPNSKMHWQVTFDQGIKNGIIDYYDSLGNKYQSSTFIDNRLSGESRTYFENGNIKAIVNYFRDTLNGDFRTFYESGEIELIAFYDKGKAIDYVRYDTTGNIIDHLLKYEIVHRKASSKIELVVEFHNPILEAVGMKLYKYRMGEKYFAINDPIVVEDSVIRHQLAFQLDRQDSVELYGVFFEIEKIKSEKQYDSGIVRSRQEFIYTFDNPQ